jgi:hypothetical protein
MIYFAFILKPGQAIICAGRNQLKQVFQPPRFLRELSEDRAVYYPFFQQLLPHISQQSTVSRYEATGLPLNNKDFQAANYALIIISMEIRGLFRGPLPPVSSLVLQLLRYIPLLLHSGPVF